MRIEIDGSADVRVGEHSERVVDGSIHVPDPEDLDDDDQPKIVSDGPVVVEFHDGSDIEERML